MQKKNKTTSDAGIVLVSFTFLISVCFFTNERKPNLFILYIKPELEL